MEQTFAKQTEMIRETCRYIEENADSPITLAQLSNHLNVSPFHFQRAFKREMGITPRQYVEIYRHEKLKSNLKLGEAVADATYEAGFGSSSRVYENAGMRLGMTPARYRKGGEGVKISYTIANSPLGLLLLAATAQGICVASFGEDEQSLEAALRKEYPNAILQRDEANLHEWIKLILEHLKGKTPKLDLPLAVSFTPFQGKVWEKLREIPYGSSCSYREVARAVGNSKAARAVARACASNPVALLIPCHRVVRGNGELGGYRWGLERKRTLLEREQENINVAEKAV